MKKNCYLFLLFISCLSLRVSSQYAWSPVGVGANLDVQALAGDTNTNVLYLGGVFTQAGGLPTLGLAKWDGVNYSPVGSGLLTGLGVSSLLVKSNGNLVAGGTFISIGGILSENISEWNGSTWLPLGGGLDLTVGVTIVKALAVYNNELYAGGTFDKSGLTPLNYIAKWDGANWQPVGSGTNGTVSSLCVYNNELYVGGTFTSAGGVIVKNIARWDGTNWSDVGGGVSYTGAISVSALQVYGGDLYAGGSFDTAGTTAVRHIARWNGINWSDPGGGASNYTGAISVSAFEVFHGELIAGGVFDTLGGISAKYVGKWNGSNWSPMGLGMNGGVNALRAVRDTLYAGGLFTLADNTPSLFVSQWKPSQFVLSVGNPSATDKFIFYPNPNNGSFLVQADQEGTFSLVNELGDRVKTIKLNSENNFSVSIENLAGGVYFVTGTQKNAVIHEKIIVTK